MNTNKANNGWTLHPSKSFPGKFYYFNVLNGESAWTSGPEKNISRDSGFHNLSDKHYFYPTEPTTPPEDYPSPSSTVPRSFIFNQLKFTTQSERRRDSNNRTDQYPSPIFGKAVFPNYVSNVDPYRPNVVWAPLPIPTVPYVYNVREVRSSKETWCQTSDIDRLHVDACDTPLSKRFTNYNLILKHLNNFYETSTPINTKNESTTQSFIPIFRKTPLTSPSRILNRETIFRRVWSKSESDKSTITSPELSKSKNLDSLYNTDDLITTDLSYTNIKTKSKEPVKQTHLVFDKDTNVTLEDFESNTLDNVFDDDEPQSRKRNKYCQENIQNFNEDTNISEPATKLPKNDLRLLLIAKRRKSDDFGEMQRLTSKKIRTYKEEQKNPTTPPKRVSFNLEVQNDSDTSDNQSEDKMQLQSLDEDPDSVLLDLREDLWYVMVDPETLVDEYQLIEEYVLSDDSCRLLLPRCLRSEIETMGMGDCCGRQRVIVARQSARKLAQPLAYIVTMPEIDISSNTKEISDVLKYCLKIYSFGNKVVFITNSSKLLTDAKSLKIPCLNTTEIKLKNTNTNEITFDLKKVKINVKKDRTENISLPSSEFKSYVLGNKKGIPKIETSFKSANISEENILSPTSEFKYYAFENKKPFSEIKTNLFEKSSDKNISEMKKFDDLKKVIINLRNGHRENIALLPTESKRYVLGNKEANPKNRQNEENIFLQTNELKHYAFENKEPFPEIKTNLFEKSSDKNMSEVKKFDDLKKVKINVRNERSKNIALLPSESKRYVLGNKEANPKNGQSEGNIFLQTSEFNHDAFENKEPFPEIKTNLFKKSSDKNIIEVKKFDNLKKVKINVRNERSENIALLPCESKRHVLGNKKANPKNGQSEENIYLQTSELPFPEIKTNVFEKSSDKNISDLKKFEDLKKVKINIRNERSENIALLSGESKRYVLGNKEATKEQSEDNIFLQTSEQAFENKKPFPEIKTNLFENSSDKIINVVKKFDDLKKVKISVKNKHSENIALLPSEYKRYVLGNKEAKNEQSKENIFLQTSEFKQAFENKEPFPEIKKNLFEKSSDKSISEGKKFDDLKKVKISVKNKHSENIALLPSESKRYVMDNKEANPKNGQSEKNIFFPTSESKHYIFENKEPFSEIKANLFEISSDKNIIEEKKFDDLKNVKIYARNEHRENIALLSSESKRYVLGNKEANPKNGQSEENIFLQTNEYKRYIFENKEPFSETKKNHFKNFSNNNISKVKKVDANTSPIGSDKLIDITRKKPESNQNDKELINYEKAAANIGIDIQNLFLNDEEMAQQNSKAKKEKENRNKLEIKKPMVIQNTKKVSIEKGESSKIHVLKKFEIKSNLMEETIKTRLDEWICSFSQIVEDALTQILTRHKKVNDSMTPPWVLYDVVDSIKKLYDSHKEVKTLADKFTTILLEQCSQIGKLKLSMAPTDFMDLLQCAFLLIQKLKANQPSYVELLEAENALNGLLSKIEDPTEDLNLLLPFTPPVGTPDIVIERVRNNYLRHPSEIIDYLKKHFDEWKNYEQTPEKGFGEHPIVNNNAGDIRIVRTCGRNIKLLNIHGKTLTVTNPTETVPKDETGNIKEDNVTSTNDIHEDLDLSHSETCNEELSNDSETIDGTVKCGNTFNEDPKSGIQENTQSVATQSLKNLNNENKNYVPKVKTETKKTFLDLETSNYSGIQEAATITQLSSSVHDENDDVKFDSDVSIADTVSFVYEIKNTNVKNTAVKNENVAESNANTTSRDASIDRFDSLTVKDESTTDSGFESESLHAYSLVKTFLFELSYTFKMVYSFVVKTIQDFRENKIQEEQKHYLHKKANLMYMTMAEIIIKLKMIIQRESTDNTELKAMLSRAGVQAAADKRILRYSQVVTKCLEQAVTLKGSLKLILSLTGNDYDGSISTCTLDTNIRYFNIFE